MTNYSHLPPPSGHARTSEPDVLVCDPDGHNLKIYATGIRNAVTVTVQPGSGKVWVSTNERDGLGDDLVPDYISSVREGGFYGWPWYYMGNHEDPRHAGKRPDLAGQVIAPDVCGMMRFPPRPYAATSVMADSSCIAFMASSESRT